MLKTMKKKIKKRRRLSTALVTTTLLLSPLLAISPSMTSAANAETKQTTQSMPWMNPHQSVDQRVKELLGAMTLDEKIGQMLESERSDTTPADVKNFAIGSILSGGGSAPATNTPTGWADMVDGFQGGALQTRLGIPIIYGIDAVHGHNNVMDATIYPHNIGLGATHNPELVKKIGAATAEEVRATGISYVFAPCLTSPQNIRWGRTYEGFSENPAISGLLGSAEVEGLQGNLNNDSFTKGKHVVATIKHYVGDGLTQGGVNEGNVTEYSPEQLQKFIQPYKEAINAGAQSVMVTYSSINGVKTHGDKHLITDVLKGELRFKGFVITDWNGAQQIAPKDFKLSIKTAMNAGIDMFMIPYNADWHNFLTTTKSLVENGEVSIDRINDAVSRILRVKFENGLFEHPFAVRSLVNQGVGTAKHRALASEAVSESMVLLKNQNHVLPLKQNGSKIFVAGVKANNIGYQAGGWTISWQGGSTQWMGEPEANLTKGTTILNGIKQAAGPHTTVDYSQDGTGAQGHDVAVVVIGEKPYAEGFGDRNSTTAIKDLKLQPDDLQLLENVKKTGVPMVVVLLSGRPMIVTDQIKDWNAFVAAWLPGTEGEGVANVLFGKHPFTGKLSYTWPRDMAQIDNHDKNNPLYPIGFGLNYSKK